MSLLNKFPKSWVDDNTENLTVILEACQKIFDRLDSESINAKNGLNVNSAQGGYLDLQGADFKVFRVSGESDENYRIRISDEMLRLRNTVSSIEAAINNLTLGSNKVYEPWQNLFEVGNSELSGEDKIIDYEYWDYHVIDVLTRVRTDVIERVLINIISAGKQLYVTHILDLFIKNIDKSITQYIEIEIDYTVAKPEALIILSNETIFDVQGATKRYLNLLSPCMASNNPYPWQDGIEVPYLQLGFRIKNEILGVDY